MDYEDKKKTKMAKVKDKTPAAVQITAEQLLREAKERELELVRPPPRQKISDAAELKDYQGRSRKDFEDKIRRNRTYIPNYLKYAEFEEKQNDLARSSSAYERALQMDVREAKTWVKYSEMQMRNKLVNSARNVLDRAITLLPRVDQLWMKYIYMEEMLNNIAASRQLFERWMEWNPSDEAWRAYINFELRYKEINKARLVYEKFVIEHPKTQNWINYAKFEERLGFVASARDIFERSMDFFGNDHLTEKLIIAFAKFEENQKEHERVRAIYKLAISLFGEENSKDIHRLYAIHEKKHGDQNSIEEALVTKRKNHYEGELNLNPFNYDAWFNYIHLMEEDGNAEVVRELYERAVVNIPPSMEKSHWRRYIYLWINYAIYEEMEMKDIDRTRQVYKACLNNLPHKKFTFAKVWLMYAKFEIRQKDLTAARKFMGTAIGMCPKDKLFREYIKLESQLMEFDRCRILYKKFLEFSPENCRTWTEFAEMEAIHANIDRARAIYELGISQPQLDMPEVLWKAYIDFETTLDKYDNVRSIYERLLEKTLDVKVWLSYALFELSTGEDTCIEKSREVYKMADKSMKDAHLKDERVAILEKWIEFEQEYGDDELLETVTKLQPRKELRSRKIETEGSNWNWEEYYEYVFPDDEVAKGYSTLLAKAKSFMKNQEVDED